MRLQYGLMESCCSDIVVTFLCPCCSLSQDYREMKMRGPPPRMTMTAPSSIPQPQPHTPSPIAPHMIASHQPMQPMNVMQPSHSPIGQYSRVEGIGDDDAPPPPYVASAAVHLPSGPIVYEPPMTGQAEWGEGHPRKARNDLSTSTIL